MLINLFEKYRQNTELMQLIKRYVKAYRNFMHSGTDEANQSLATVQRALVNMIGLEQWMLVETVLLEYEKALIEEAADIFQ